MFFNLWHYRSSFMCEYYESKCESWLCMKNKGIQFEIISIQLIYMFDLAVKFQLQSERLLVHNVLSVI